MLMIHRPRKRADMLLITTFCFCASCPTGNAQETVPDTEISPASEDLEASRQNPAMSDEEFLADYQAKYAALIEPVEEHKLFNQLEGEWTRTYSYLLNPDANAATRIQRTIVYGGRFLLETEYSNLQESLSEGTAILGFNRVLGQYERVFWHDMTTGITFSTGKRDPQTGELTFSWRFREPILDYPIQAKLVWRLVNQDRIEQTFYEAKSDADPDDTNVWRRAMEIVEERIR